MKKIEAIIRAELMSAVKERLRELGVSDMTVSDVSGCSILLVGNGERCGCSCNLNTLNIRLS